MTAFEYGRVFGMLFLSAFPTAIVCYRIWKDSPKGRIFWSIGGFFVGCLGGLIMGIPYMLVSWYCKKIK